MNSLYFDYAATTPVDPEVMEAMLPYFKDTFGNPSSTHQYGQKAEGAVEHARELIASLINCSHNEVVFTSGGTEADNMALRGAAFSRKSSTGANRILITPVEHDAILNTAKQLQANYGFQIEYIPVDKVGKVDISTFSTMLDSNVAIVSVIYGNNEIGTINPVTEIGGLCHEYGIPFHTDAVQAMGYCSITAKNEVDMISAGAHKFYGPKGVGFLYKSNSIKVLPTQTGGGQERGNRAGTHNVPYIVGMAIALQKARINQEKYREHYQNLRNEIINRILIEVPDVILTGSQEERLSNHASFVFTGVDGNELVMMLDMAGVACSSGSACKTGNPEPSEVLLALGYSAALAKGSLRITVGRDTRKEDVDLLIPAVAEAVRKARI